MGPARLTLLNAGLRVDYPWPRAASALAAAAAAVAVAVLLRSRWMRVGAVVFALAAGTAAAHLLLYRVEAGGWGVEARGLFGSRRLAWEAVDRVESAPDLLVLTGTEGAPVRVDTTDFRPQDRATLDRVIARRLRGER